MERLHNIFNGIVNNENDMTELLYNFLFYKPFRDAFVKLFFDNPDLVAYDNFQTQFRTDINQSRPDMAIVNDECEFLIEIKTWDTGLTGNQPNSYLEYLKKIQKRHRHLVFLVPSNYNHLIEWHSRTEVWQKANIHNINIKTIFWDEILSIITKNDLNKLSEKFKDFYELLNSWFKIDLVTFDRLEVKYMFNTQVPKILIKLFKTVDVVNNYFSKMYKVKKSVYDTEYGIYIKNSESNSDLLYFGIWYEFWEKYGYPLCYGIDSSTWNKDLVTKFESKHKDSIINKDGFLTIFIAENIVNTDDCSEKIINIIKEELIILNTNCK